MNSKELKRELISDRRDIIENVLPTLKTGDIILTSSKSLMVWFMKKFQTDPVRWGHCLVVKNINEAWEAHWKLRTYDLNKFFNNKLHWKIIRKVDITEDQRRMMKQIAPLLLGKIYGFWRIILQMLDHIFKTDKFSGANMNIYIQVCSSFAAWIYYMTTNYKFNGVEWASCDPDDIEDDSEEFPERWKILAQKLPNN